MQPFDLENHALGALIKISAITGWIIPSGDIGKVLENMFQKKLVQTYPDITPDEIEFAFMNYAGSVKDWGKNMNLVLFDQVMNIYLTERSRVDNETEIKIDVPEQKIYTEKELDNLARKDTEAYYQRLRAGNVLKKEKTPDYVAPILIKDNLIKDESEVNSFLMHRLSVGIKNIYEEKKTENE